MHKQTVSAVILTKNEEKNIERCIASLGWCDEIVIIDDFSEDGTIDKTRNKFQIQIFKRKLNGDFAAQRNFGLEKASGEWVLFIDADEIITEELHIEIIKTIQKNATADICMGYLIKRRDYFLGKWLEHGETSRVKFLRLARRDAGLWKGKVHEIWEVEGKLGELKNPILHYPHPTVSEFMKEVNWYTDIVAQCWKEEGRKISFWEIVFYPLGKFIQNYIIRLGFLDGTAGLIMVIFMSFHSFLARSKYWLMTNKS